MVAQVAGVNLKPIEYKDPKVLAKYVENVLKIKDESYERIFIEELDREYTEVKRSIETKTSLTFPTGKNIMYYNLPMIIKDISKIMRKDMSKQEVLLVVDNKEEALELINITGDIFNFISLIGLYGEEAEEIYEEVLDKMGISIFQPLDIEKTISDYGIIINQSEEPNLNLEKAKGKAIIFDLSISKIFSKVPRHLIINDIMLNLKNLDMKDNPWIASKVSSDIYEGLFIDDVVKYCQISTKNKSYYIEEYINQGMKIKGSL